MSRISSPPAPARGPGPAAGLAAAASRQEGGARRYVARRPDPAPGAGARRGAGPGWAARRKCAAALGWARAGPAPQPAPPACGERRRCHGAVEVCVDLRAGGRAGWVVEVPWGGFLRRLGPVAPLGGGRGLSVGAEPRAQGRCTGPRQARGLRSGSRSPAVREERSCRGPGTASRYPVPRLCVCVHRHRWAVSWSPGNGSMGTAGRG